jgi:hypothetical protein
VVLIGWGLSCVPGRSLCGLGVVLTIAIWPVAASAQNADGSNATLMLSDKLPRPGYEPRSLRIGGATIAAEVGFETRYDSNIFAVSTAPISDMIVIATPRLVIDGEGNRLAYDGQAFADIRRYADQTSESQTTFGVAGGASYAIDSGNRMIAGARIERLAETRNDPEADTNLGLPPRLLDSIGGRLEYAHTTGRAEFELRGAASHLGYRQPEDAERSLAIYYLAARATLVATPAIAVFIQPYFNRRNFDLAVDTSGVNRDASTFGVIGGVRLTTTGRWSGEIGVGAFRANPDDTTLQAFSGFAANANLTWSPQPRTTITLRAVSGDAATVRAGATGRFDTGISLRIDQEVRHNLRFSASVGYQRTEFRGLSNSRSTRYASTQIEYLINRTVSLFMTGNIAARRAEPASDGFDRSYVGIGLRLRH